MRVACEHTLLVEALTRERLSRKAINQHIGNLQEVPKLLLAALGIELDCQNALAVIRLAVKHLSSWPLV